MALLIFLGVFVIFGSFIFLLFYGPKLLMKQRGAAWERLALQLGFTYSPTPLEDILPRLKNISFFQMLRGFQMLNNLTGVREGVTWRIFDCYIMTRYRFSKHRQKEVHRAHAVAYATRSGFKFPYIKIGPRSPLLDYAAKMAISMAVAAHLPH